ncbi:MAG: CheR family methyltransferase [Candidatus Hermodarchaeota archaeon]
MIRIDDIQIDEDYYNLLIHLLMNTTGLNLEYYQRNFVEKRIKSRMIRVGCNTLESYYNFLLENACETDKFLDCFNINYSVFFRNWEVFKEFESIILSSLYLSENDIISDLVPNPDRQYKKNLLRVNKNWDSKKKINSTICEALPLTSLYKKIWKYPKKKANINIWSVPCANGEEPYSIAMILDNLKKQIPGFPFFRIIASDIDKDAIIKAKHGIYNEDSTKNISKYYEDKYFDKIKENFSYIYVLNNKIKENVEFMEEDVTDGHRLSLKYDIIFCRYLLIYISRSIREEFLNIIRSRLNPGGLLILGKTETLLNSHSDLKLIDSYNRIYIKIR